MNRKIWKALGIAVCMLALAAPRAMAVSRRVGSDADFKKAVEEINQSGDGKNEIILTQNFTLEGNTTDYTLTNGKETTTKTTTIKGEGNTITVNPGAGITVAKKGTVLNLGAEGYKGTLTIDGKTSGGSASGNANNAFVSVLEGATANMYENVTLQNGEFAGNACVVVKGLKPVTGPNSAFNMYGGVIENCSRAVIAYSWATFHMFDGEIKKCKADGDDVISVTDNSKFIMEGGTISGCKANTGGGLYANNSAIEISGGTISGCTAEAGGGLYADNSTVTINNGTISECTAAIKEGGGLYATNSSEITISGGTISGCKAPSSDKGNGSGLYANHSTIKITGGTISGCEGRWGGGLYAENSSTIEISGGTISRCKVGAGGGLFVTGSTLNIEGGTISECSTTLDTGKGGGLYAENSTITISGGTIKDNEAAHGGGVALTGVKKFEKPITNWTVDGNKAYKTGGGIWLGEKVDLDISDRTNRIYNNHAIEHGADICLERGNSAIKLPIAANMGATFGDSGIYIDGWYNDDNPRYEPSESGVAVDISKTLTGPRSLVASYKAVPVRTVTINANGGVGGSSSQTVQKGTTVTLEAPTKEGYLFTGWEDENKKIYPAGEDGKVNITVNENMKLRAVWEARTFTVTYVLLNGETRTETVNYGQTVTLGEEPRTGYTFVGWKDGEKMYHAGETITVMEDKTLTAEWKKLPSAENLPKTGDESPVLLWGAALAVSAAACFVLRRKK